MTLTLKLKQAATKLMQHGWVSLLPGQLTLLDAPHRNALDAVLARRPRYSLNQTTRPFASLRDLAEIAALIEDAAQQSLIVQRGLGVEARLLEEAALQGCSPARPLITIATLACTVAANALLDRPPALVPLAPGDLRRLRDQATEAGQLTVATRTRLRSLWTQRLREREVALPATWESWVDRWLAHLERTLAPSTVGAPGGDPRNVTGLLVHVE